jgi:hypothetical protein
VRELNVSNRVEELKQELHEEYGSVIEQCLGKVDKEEGTFREALVRCAKIVCDVRRVTGC